MFLAPKMVLLGNSSIGGTFAFTRTALAAVFSPGGDDGRRSPEARVLAETPTATANRRGRQVSAGEAQRHQRIAAAPPGRSCHGDTCGTPQASRRS
jgi:hypothetical protein